jgi:hypothetical protein
VTGQFQNAHVCDGDTATLSCKDGERLAVHSAVYGYAQATAPHALCGVHAPAPHGQAEHDVEDGEEMMMSMSITHLH